MDETMPHVIEVFTGGCPFCRATLDMVELGKCASCILTERDLAEGGPEGLRKAETYGVRAVPTIIIDGRIKVEGKPDFLWMCGDEFYAMLEQRFPLRRRNPAAGDL